MYSKRVAVDGFVELHLRIGAIGQAPAHHLETKFRPLRFDGIDDLAGVFYGRSEEFGGKILLVGPIPIFVAVGADNINAT